MLGPRAAVRRVPEHLLRFRPGRGAPGDNKDMSAQTAGPQTSRPDQKIVPCVWFDHDAAEAYDFYTRVFRDAEVLTTQRYPDDAASLPDFQKDLAGQLLTADLQIAGYRVLLLNADRTFRPTPALNFMLNFDPVLYDDARDYLDAVHSALLADGGVERMPLGEYPFSPHYAWVEDRFGVNWQLMLTDPEGDPRPFMMPSFMFGGAHQNESTAAVDTYLSLFPDSALSHRVTYGDMGGVPETGQSEPSPATADSIAFSDFRLAGQWFVAMDSGAVQDFTFTEALSLVVNVDDQQELDHYWDALSHVPESEVCGWLKDRFGVSWQITPRDIDELLRRPGAYDRMMRMSKLVIADF